jgi:Fic family protein
LRQEDFKKQAPGKLVRSLNGYWTFEPNPLPPAISFDVSLVRQLTEADRALGELAGIGRMLPNPHLLIGPFLRREAILSSRIEGTVTRLEELLLFEVQPEETERPPDVGEVVNYVRALEYGLARLKDLPVCVRLLCEIHEHLLEGVRGMEKRPGKIRDKQVFIGREGQHPDDMRFIPPMQTQLPEMLTAMERFLNFPSDLPLIVQLALVHYQFETIHPFQDGNGRIGRLLISLMLCERSSLPQPLLYLSAFFERHNSDYRDLMLAVSQKGAWSDWIRFFAQGIAEQSRDAIERAKRLLDLWQSYRQRLQAKSQSVTILALIDELFASPIVTVSYAEKKLGVTYPAANNNIAKLVAEGILRETTKKQRNRVYVADAILKLLDESTDLTPEKPPGK